jgi:hypothetical protein
VESGEDGLEVGEGCGGCAPSAYVVVVVVVVVVGRRERPSDCLEDVCCAKVAPVVQVVVADCQSEEYLKCMSRC